MSFEYLQSFFENNGKIHCASFDERENLLSDLQSLGFELGFDESSYADTPWFFIFMSHGYIHMMGGNPSGDIIEYNELISSPDLLDDVDLPKLSELYGACFTT